MKGREVMFSSRSAVLLWCQLILKLHFKICRDFSALRSQLIGLAKEFTVDAVFSTAPAIPGLLIKHHNISHLLGQTWMLERFFMIKEALSGSDC